MTRSFFYISGFTLICQNFLIDILIADGTEIRHVHRYIQPQVYMILYSLWAMAAVNSSKLGAIRDTECSISGR